MYEYSAYQYRYGGRRRYQMLDCIKAKGRYALMKRTAGNRDLWKPDSMSTWQSTEDRERDE